MANVMKEIAKALGVELEEEFDIKGYGKHKLTKDGLVCWSNVYQDWDSSYILPSLLRGKNIIIKLSSESILTEKEKEYRIKIAANVMKEVANALGVELGEEFRLKNFPNKFKITKVGIMAWSDISHKWFLCYWIYKTLLAGSGEIIKISKPIKQH